MALSQMVKGKTHRKKNAPNKSSGVGGIKCCKLQAESCKRRPNAADVNGMIMEMAMTLTTVSTKIANWKLENSADALSLLSCLLLCSADAAICNEICCRSAIAPDGWMAGINANWLSGNGK